MDRTISSLEMTSPLYTTIEEVRQASDVKAAAYATDRVRRVVDSASRSVEDVTNRVFYPLAATRYYDWPSRQQTGPSWVLDLGADLLSLTTLTSGGSAISTSDVFLEPSTGPPYRRIETDLSTSASWQAGDTHQRAITVTGVWGYTSDTTTGSTLAEDLDASETGIDVASSASIGTGDTILIGSEYCLVTDRVMLDTGVDIAVGGDLTASRADVSLACDTATGIPVVGETILIGSERMLVVDAAGTTLTVRRAYDGTTLAAHAAAASIYAPRTLTVERGALGTTAATHTTGDTVYRHAVPALVRDLVIAEAIVRLGHEASGYSNQVGGQDTDRRISFAALRDLRREIEEAYRVRRWASGI